MPTTWDSAFEASPANTDAANAGAAKIRELKTAISERLELEMNFKTGTQPLLKAGVAAVCYSGTAAQIANLANCSNGALAFNTTSNNFQRYNGANWANVAIDHGTLTGNSDNDHPQYLMANSANQTIAANLLVAAGITIDGRDLSVDGALLAKLLSSFLPPDLVISANATTPANAIDVSANNIVCANGASYISGNISSVVDFTTTGANALDAGSVAANTWYYLWAVANASAVAVVASANSTAPTLPAGYTHYRMVGVTRTANGANLAKTYQHGRVVRIYTTSTAYVDTGNHADWTIVDLTNYLPPAALCTKALLQVYSTANLIVSFLRPYGSSANGISLSSSNIAKSVEVWMDMGANQSIEYRQGSNTFMQITVCGMELKI